MNGIYSVNGRLSFWQKVFAFCQNEKGSRHLTGAKVPLALRDTMKKGLYS